MKRQIFKYSFDVAETVTLTVPKGAIFLAVNTQGAFLAAWFIVDSEQTETEEFNLLVAGTGMVLSDEVDRANYLGTVLQGGYVWHVFKKV